MPEKKKGARGRPAHNKSGAMEATISVYFDERQAKAVQAAARKKGVSPDAFIRDATILKVAPDLHVEAPAGAKKWAGTFESQRRPVRFPARAHAKILAHAATRKIPKAVLVREATLEAAGHSELGLSRMLS